jgi:ABC-type antimicrobial peptide transport system permease subunit
MIINFFKTAFRNLWRNKFTSAINLFGLAIGMTAAVYIFIWVQNELTFDNYHPAKKNIYRITSTLSTVNGNPWVWENSPTPAAEVALKEIPEIERTARLKPNAYGLTFNLNNKLFSEKSSAYIDASWFNMFQYEFIEGNAASFAQDPFGIVLTESKAKKYFGNANAVGQVIRIDTVNYSVEGVVRDNPVNSSFQFDIMIQLQGRLANPARRKSLTDWNNYDYITFLERRADADKSVVEAKLNLLFNKNAEGSKNVVSLVGLPAMYFENDLQSSLLPHGSKKTTYIFSLLGFLLLFIGCINYVNLTTARASLRSKEVSVRKIVGAQRSHLFFQFIAESLTISLLALLTTLVIINIGLPVFNEITETPFQLPLTSVTMWKVLLGTLLVATFLNGIYPAILLSSFQPLNVFRGKSILKLRDGNVRKGLVIIQFALSMVLIIGTIVMYRQLNFIQSTNPGYNISQVVSVHIPSKSYANLKDNDRKTFFASLKHEWQSQSSIAGVSNAGEEIVNVGSYSTGNADWDGHDTTYKPQVARFSADEDFQEMFGLELKEGRWFREGKEDAHNYILNETAVKEFRMNEPVTGQRFTWGGDTGQVIAVVKDFHYKSLHEKIGPMVLFSNEGLDSYFFIKINPGNLSGSLSDIGAVWNQFIPGQPFDYNFLDDSFNKLYKTDKKTSRLIFIFSLIAILISALGLFALAAFTAEQRTKEIGIRKVMGASVRQIASMLSADFVQLVIVAILIASPIAWWVMNKWLLDFAYRANINVWIFILAGIMILLIAILTISFQAIKAATTNPVKSLRTE